MPGEAGRGGRARSAGKRSSAGKPLPRGMLGSVVRPAGPRRAASPPLPAAGPDASWAGPGASLPAPPPRSGGRWTCCGGGWAPREEGLPPPLPPEGGGAPAGRVFTSERRKGEPGPCSRVTDPGTPPARRCRRRQGPSSAPAGRAPPAGRHSRACCRAEGGRSSTRCASNYANSPTASPFFEELVFLCLTFWEALALLPWHNLAPFNLGLLEVCGQWAPAQFMAMLCFALPTARVTYQTRQTWLLQL